MTRIKSDHAATGFPFKLGEFLATGKAVIATNVGDVSKYLLNDVNSIVISPNSSDQIVSAITSLIENPEKIKQLGAKGRETAETFFDSQKTSATFHQVLNLA
jgi:glycosyltransferase involved in cell wall biosynthesis